jgi:hypothetical protein
LNPCTDGDGSLVKAMDLDPSASTVEPDGGCQSLDDDDDDGGY